jgi:hypothetical protein
MPAYTNIAKPTDATYTSLGAEGRQTFDESLITYDDSTTYYDSTNVNAYSNIAKPTGSSYTNINKPTT